MPGLWGDDFVVQNTKSKTKKIIEKANNPKKVKKSAERSIASKTLSIEDKIKIIYENVDNTLGVYKDSSEVIKTREDLTRYIDKAIENNIIAIDTETNNSLDPITCQLMGPCIYTPGEKNAYIPLNHRDLYSNERLEWQLTEADIAEEFARLADTTIVMHNGKFDYQVIKCTCGVTLHIDWDTMVGAKVLDENEKSAGLKQQYIAKIDPSIEKYSIDKLFEKIEYAIIDPDKFALYAATDAYMTYKLYEWQKAQFELAGSERLYSLFKTVEMPIVIVAADMELAGVEVDQEYAKLLSAKYHRKLDQVDSKIAAELGKYKDKVEAWRLTDDANFHPKSKKPNKDGIYTDQKSKNEQLDWPINLASPTQLAILLYDVLGTKTISKKSPRGTGEDILKKINLPICDLILERRGLIKLTDTYIDNIPKLVNIDGRVHTHFNQYGAQTGRFSSSDPLNLQNIPSHNKEIRMLFKPKDGYMFIGSDYSAQEVRLLAAYSKDDNMLQTYIDGKDLYSSVASMVYKNSYEENREFWPDGSANPDGKKRRGFCKSVVLGLMYGRGVSSIAEQIKSHEGPVTQDDIAEAQDITDKFFNNYPKVKEWIDATIKHAHETGYVEDLWGRRRRLPDIQLPRYEITNLNQISEFNPLLYSSGKLDSKINTDKYIKLLNNCRGRKEVDAVKQQAERENIKIKDNTGFVAQAERQCVNARIQGGAATLSKRAMIAIHDDPIMQELGFRLLIAVHDELIGECPASNAGKAAERLTYLMSEAAKPECQIPMKCDPTIESCWYLTDYQDLVRKEFKKLLEKYTAEEAFNIIAEERTESTIPQLQETLAEFLT